MDDSCSTSSTSSYKTHDRMTFLLATLATLTTCSRLKGDLKFATKPPQFYFPNGP